MNKRTPNARAATHATVTQTCPITVAGLAICTSNGKTFEDSPAHWSRFSGQQMLTQIPHKISDELYAGYTEFDRIPQQAADICSLGYTFIIGVAVFSTAGLTAPLVSTIIPAAKRAVFAVQPSRPEQVGALWQKIWQMRDLPRVFAPDYEHYAADGTINILVSVV